MTSQEFFLAISNKRHIIFDFDATLATLDIDWSEWHPGLIEIIKKYEPSFERGTLSGAAYGNRENKLRRKYGPKLSNELLAFKKEYELSNYSGYTKHNKTVNILEKLVTSGWRASLWTSNFSETVLRPLEEMRIKNVFTHFVSGSEVELQKPDPEGFKKIINQDNHPLEEFLMIGDSSSDKEAAYNAGIGFLHVSEISDHLPDGWSL